MSRRTRSLALVGSLALLATVMAPAAVSSAGAASSGGTAQRDVCASGCPHQTIQTAVDAAPANSTVRVGPGTYPEEVTLTKPLSLLGEPGTVLDGGAERAVGLRVLAEDVLVSGLEVRGYTAYGLVFEAADRLEIRGNAFEDNDIGVQHVEGRGDPEIRAEGVRIVDNAFVGNHALGLRLQYVEGSEVRDNTFHANGGFGAILFFSWDNLVRGNTFSDHEASGLSVSNSWGDRILENVARDNGGAGLELWFASDPSVVANEAAGNEIGIALPVDNDNGTFEANTVTGSGSHGFLIWNHIRNGRFMDNDVRGNGGHGFYLNFAFDWDAEYPDVNELDNVFRGNRAIDNGGYGLFGSVSRTQSIEGNRFAGNGQGGLHMHAMWESVVAGNEIEDNHGSGVDFFSSWGSVIEHNLVAGNQGHGLHLHGGGHLLVPAHLEHVIEGGDPLDDSWTNPTTIFRSNVIANNDGGMVVDVQGHARWIASANNFTGNGVGLITPAIPVDARDNWWGCPEGPFLDAACDEILGAGLHAPWSDEPHSEAGPGGSPASV